ncbi:BTB/POZ protein [Hypoxylon sp. NC0597]|nr:BTB/POZ protein [Hypoxylon sp. NC0597]
MDSLTEENKKLWEDDFMKDAIIECGNRVWKVHKLILATRSEWFKKALCGQFTESQCAKVVIHEQDPKHVNWILTWIYSREFDKEDFTEEQDTYENYLKFYRIADFFCLEDAQAQARKKLEETLNTKVGDTMAYYVPGMDYSGDEETISDDYSGFFNGVRLAYQFGYDWAKSAFVNLVAQTNYWIFCNDIFRSQCKTVPEFYQDLINRFVEVSTSSNWSSSPPSKCYSCKKKREVGGKFYWGKAIVKNGAYWALCSSCEGDKKYV